MALTDLTRTGVIPASGTLSLFVTPSARQNWTVQQISISAPTVSALAVGNIYRNGQFVSFFIPSGDMVGDVPYLPLANGRTLEIRWTNATPGAAVQATLFYDDGQG